MRGFLKRVVKKVLERPLGRIVEETLSLSALDVAIDLALGNQVEGDYLEFGVYRGGSFVRAYKRFVTNENGYGTPRTARFFAFDSFEGLPDSQDAERPKQYETGAYAAGEAQLRETLERNGVELQRVRIIKKWFNDLNEEDKAAHDLKHAAVIYIDCDVYESTKSALNFVRDLLVDGSVIVFDDFYRHKASRHHGVRRAWEEFLEQNPQLESTVVHLFRRIAFAINTVAVPSQSKASVSADRSV